MVVSFTRLQPTVGIAHGDPRLVCGCSATEINFMKCPTNSYFADIASRGSLELGRECCNRGQTFFTRYSTVCLWRLHGCVLDFILPSATGVAEIAESTNLKG